MKPSCSLRRVLLDPNTFQIEISEIHLGARISLFRSLSIPVRSLIQVAHNPLTRVVIASKLEFLTQMPCGRQALNLLWRGVGVDIAGGTLTNTGTISGGSSPNYTPPSPVGGTGVAATNASLTNTGHISGGIGHAGGSGVHLTGGGLINGGVIAGAGGNAVGFGGGPGGYGGMGVYATGASVTNTGAIGFAIARVQASPMASTEHPIPTA